MGFMFFLKHAAFPSGVCYTCGFVRPLDPGSSRLCLGTFRKWPVGSEMMCLLGKNRFLKFRTVTIWSPVRHLTDLALKPKCEITHNKKSKFVLFGEVVLWNTDVSTRFPFQTCVWNFALFSFLLFFLPILPQANLQTVSLRLLTMEKVFFHRTCGVSFLDVPKPKSQQGTTNSEPQR